MREEEEEASPKAAAPSLCLLRKLSEEVGLTMTSGAWVISEEGFPSQGTQTPAGGEVRVGEGLESKRETGQKSGAPGPAQWGSAPLGRGVTSTLASVMLEGKKKKKTAVWGLSQPTVGFTPRGLQGRTP